MITQLIHLTWFLGLNWLLILRRKTKSSTPCGSLGTGLPTPGLEEAFMTKAIKYQPLLHTISELGYRCRLLVFIFGSLGHTHRLVIRRLQQLGMPKKGTKRLAKYCAVSAIIGNHHIWRRRCYLYP